MEYPQINFVSAFDNARRGWEQRIRNVMGNPLLPYSPVNPYVDASWPEPNRVRYHLGGAVYIELRNIRPASFNLDIGDPVTIQSSTEIVNRTNVDDPVKHGKFEEDYTFTFGAVDSFSDKATVALEQGLAVKFGNEYDHIKAELESKFTEANEKERSQQKHWDNTIHWHLEHETPLNLTIWGQRDKSKTQSIIDINMPFEFEIAIRYEYADGSWAETSFPSRQILLDYLRGNASDAIGVTHVHHVTGETFGQHIESDTYEATASYFRAHPQPHVDMPNSDINTTITVINDNVIDQDVKVIDHSKNPDYKGIVTGKTVISSGKDYGRYD